LARAAHLDASQVSLDVWCGFVSGWMGAGDFCVALVSIAYFPSQPGVLQNANHLSAFFQTALGTPKRSKSH
jgi:hypothetical protein